MAGKEKIELYTPEQRLFVLYFIEQNFKNGGGAYRRAYPNCKSENSANVSASRMLRTSKIRDLIKAEMDKLLSDKKEFLEHQIFNFWFMRMSYDPTQIINIKGELAITNEELRAKGLDVCIDSVNKKINAQGSPYLEYKLADRDKAADQLAKYINMIRPLPTVNINVEKTGELTAEEEALYQDQLRAIKGIK